MVIEKPKAKEKNVFNLNSFIGKYITKRDQSLFYSDITENRELIYEKLRNKSVLVIGGAGSIGSSFIKAILPYSLSEIVVVDINENALAELTRDLRSTGGIVVPKTFVTYPMDYSSKVFEKMFRARGGFNYVANFSAHKHVRTEKDIYSIEAMLQNNILHAKSLLDLLSELPPEVYFCVSTDKAANPVNIMGASKRIMEDVIFTYSDIFPVKTARFANVAFSNGSLPAGFLNRIQKLQPLSAPFDVRRYFVSPEESGQICMLSCVLGNNREIFFPRLEEAQMMTFDKIATNLILENGYEVIECTDEKKAIEASTKLLNGSKEYPVCYSHSDTSGEKAFEEFFTEEEEVDFSRMKSLGIVINKIIPDKTKVKELFEKLKNVFAQEKATKEEVVQIIKEYLPNFEHVETGKSLDDKM
jgi:polysaccharide biosynthesis protein